MKTNHERRNNLCKLLLAVVAIAVLTLPGMALVQDIGSPDPEALKGLYPGKAYSPFAGAVRYFPGSVRIDCTVCGTGRFH